MTGKSNHMLVQNLRRYTLAACLLSLLLLFNVPLIIGQTFLPPRINAIAWNADDTLIAAEYEDGNVKITDLTGHPVRTIEGEFTTSITWHPFDPAQIVVANFEREPNRLIDVQTSIVLTRFNDLAYWTYDAAFSPDGTKIAFGLSDITQSSSQEGLIQIYDVATEKKLLETFPSPSAVTSVKWSPDGERIVGNQAGSLTFWDTATGAVVGYIPEPEYDEMGDRIPGLSIDEAWSHDGYVLASVSAGVDFWDTTTYKTYVTPTFTEENYVLARAYVPGIVSDIAWRPDNDTVAAGGREGIWFINAVNRDVLETPIRTEVRALAWNSDGSKLAYDSPDGVVQIADIPLPELALQPIADAGPDQTIVASPNGLVYVTLDGSGSSDPDGTIVEYNWGANDGGGFLGHEAVSNVILRPGVHTITLYIRDDAGLTATDEVTITVEASTDAYTPPITIEGELVYSRRAVRTVDYITLTGTSRKITEIDDNQCATTSYDGQYLAYTAASGAKTLTVMDLTTHEILRVFDWSPNWRRCDIAFTRDNRLMVPDQLWENHNETPDVYLMDIHTGEVEGPTKPPSFIPQYPPLPDMAYVLWGLKSPADDRYLYARCVNGGEVYIPDFGDLSCSTSLDWVVYDADAQEVIYTLEKVSAYSLTDSLVTVGSLSGAAWSSDGRYLAYLGVIAPGYQTGFPLKIYDFETQQQLKTNFVGADVDKAMGLHWSPDNRKVAVWATSRVGEEPQPGDENYQSLRVLVIFDLDTLRYTVADRPYDMWWNDGYWSPDSQRFAFVNRQGELIYLTLPSDSDSDDGYQIRSGVTVVLDFGVEALLDWRSVPSR